MWRRRLLHGRGTGPPLVLLGAATVAALALACGGNSGSNDPDTAAVALPPATAIPADANPNLELPEGVEQVVFSYTDAVLEAPGGRAVSLGMLVADTFERRRRGMMHRPELPPNTGMLFAFPALTNGPFWNRDTPLDLDIAFLDGDGVILEIQHLEAFSPKLVSPEESYHYTVEMPLGWFEANAFGRGARFGIPESVEGRAE